MKNTIRIETKGQLERMPTGQVVTIPERETGIYAGIEKTKFGDAPVIIYPSSMGIKREEIYFLDRNQKYGNKIHSIKNTSTSPEKHKFYAKLIEHNFL